MLNTTEKWETKQQDVRLRIVQAAAELFPQYGIKAVSMDEIAKQVGISKRTLYEYFNDKEDLLVACLEHNSATMTAWGIEMSNKAPTVLHIIMEIYHELMPKFQNYSPKFHEDMLRYPKVLTLIKEMRKERTDEIKEFFKAGLEQGIFLPGINYDILSRMILRMMDLPVSKEMTEKYSIGEIRSTVMLTLLRGTCTRKGEKIFDDYLAEYRSQNEDN